MTSQTHNPQSKEMFKKGSEGKRNNRQIYRKIGESRRRRGEGRESKRCQSLRQVQLFHSLHLANPPIFSILCLPIPTLSNIFCQWKEGEGIVFRDISSV